MRFSCVIVLNELLQCALMGKSYQCHQRAGKASVTASGLGNEECCVCTAYYCIYTQAVYGDHILSVCSLFSFTWSQLQYYIHSSQGYLCL